MFASLQLPALLTIFGACAGVIWFAGVQLADTTDILSTRFNIGAALGGIIILAVTTNLPEIAITVSASLAGELGVAVGNILGGIAIQTVVLAIMDMAMTERIPLSYRAASLTLVVEAVLVVAVLVVAIMATQLPKDMIAFRLTPGVLSIAALWLVGIWLCSIASRALPWHDTTGAAPDSQKDPKGHSKLGKVKAAEKRGHGTSRTLAIFMLAALTTLVAGFFLERSGDAIAKHIGLSGVLFGATVLAAATALPEVATGITSVRMKDYQLAVSDIFGGNAFLPVLFLLAVLVSGKSVLPDAQASDIYLAALGILLTCVYVIGLIFRPRRQVLRMGIDSVVVIGLYLIGMLGLFAIAGQAHA